MSKCERWATGSGAPGSLTHRSGKGIPQGLPVATSRSTRRRVKTWTFRRPLYWPHRPDLPHDAPLAPPVVDARSGPRHGARRLEAFHREATRILARSRRSPPWAPRWSSPRGWPAVSVGRSSRWRPRPRTWGAAARARGRLRRASDQAGGTRRAQPIHRGEDARSRRGGRGAVGRSRPPPGGARARDHRDVPTVKSWTRLSPSASVIDNAAVAS